MVVVNEAQNLVYVTAAGNLLFAVDGANDSPLALLTMPGSVTNNLFERRIAIHNATGRVYVRSADFPAPSRLIIVDGKRTSPTFNTIVAQLTLGREDGSGDIAVDQSGNRVVVTSNSDFQTAVINALTDTVVNTVPAVMTRFRIGINPVNHRAFVTGGVGFIQAIDLATGALQSTIGTGAEVLFPLFDPTTHVAYVPSTTTSSTVGRYDESGALGSVTGLPHGVGRLPVHRAKRGDQPSLRGERGCHRRRHERRAARVRLRYRRLDPFGDRERARRHLPVLGSASTRRRTRSTSAISRTVPRSRAASRSSTAPTTRRRRPT